MQGKAPTWRMWLLILFVVPPAFFAFMFALWLMIDGIGHYDEQHARCLRHASNGYEIERCH